MRADLRNNRGCYVRFKIIGRELIEQMLEEKLIYIIQIMRGINGLFGATENENEE